MMSVFRRLLPKTRKQQAVEEYSLGLAAKYAGSWKESFAHNKRASELNENDEATWWNLGIAATALRDWTTARLAWSRCSIELEPGEDETHWEEAWSCVRLNPNDAAEVVWGWRLDPCRIRVMNVPLPSSGRRYGDIILADGAQNGTRISDGPEYPVFDELEVWRSSPYSTFEAELSLPNEGALEALVRLCEEQHCSVESWGTLRILCKACSEGHPGEHTCSSRATQQGRFGFAAQSEASLRSALAAWREVEPEASIGSLELQLAAFTH